MANLWILQLPPGFTLYSLYSSRIMALHALLYHLPLHRLLAAQLTRTKLALNAWASLLHLCAPDESQSSLLSLELNRDPDLDTSAH